MTRTTLSTHSGTPSQFKLFGLEGRHYIPLIGSLLISIIGFALLTTHANDTLSLGMRLFLAMIPVAATTGFILLFVQGRPPHYFTDTLGLYLEGKHFNLKPTQFRRAEHWVLWEDRGISASGS